MVGYVGPLWSFDQDDDLFGMQSKSLTSARERKYLGVWIRDTIDLHWNAAFYVIPNSN